MFWMVCWVTPNKHIFLVRVYVLSSAQLSSSDMCISYLIIPLLHFLHLALPTVVRVTGQNVLPVFSDLYLTCETAGIPPPSVIWLFQGQEVVPSLDSRVTFPATNSLLVRLTQEDDSGDQSLRLFYLCFN